MRFNDLVRALTPPDFIPQSAKLKPDEREALDAIIRHFNARTFALPLFDGANYEVGLSDREMMFLSQETIRRFYARECRTSSVGLDVRIANTIAKLETTLMWRRTEGLEDIEAMTKAANEEMETATVFTLGFSSSGMPILYFFPNRNYLPPDKRSPATSFFIIERMYDLMANGQDQLLMIFSFVGKREGAMPTVQLVKDLIIQFQHHYPETLGKCYLLDVPWWMRAFINIIWPFVDPHTKRKVKKTSGHAVITDSDVPADELLIECGGKLDLPYKHKTYMNTLLRMSLARREEQYRAWMDLGPPSVGRKESQFKVAHIMRPCNHFKEGGQRTMTIESGWDSD